MVVDVDLARCCVIVKQMNALSSMVVHTESDSKQTRASRELVMLDDKLAAAGWVAASTDCVVAQCICFCQRVSLVITK